MKNILLTPILAVAFMTPAALAAENPAVKSVRLYVFDCGRLRVEDPSRFNLKKEEMKNLDMSVGCYMIAHPKGTLLWDVGVIPDKNFPANGPASKLYASSNRTLKSQMVAAGYQPENANFLAMSHAHWDHLANANEFAKATWLTRAVERGTLFGPNPPERSTPDEYDALKSAKSISLPEGDYDVFGDGSVVIKPAYGHTPGHSVLFVKLAKTGPVLLSGDLYHYPEEITLDRYPTFEFNKEQTQTARANIQAFLKQSGAKLWIQHDLAAFEKLKKAPGYYE
jgi:glyoxylase-like metal-dependent hydrolase (beta-lactamase superfamily II)